MTTILFLALYVASLVGTIVLMDAEVPAGMILFVFIFVAIFGGLYLFATDRPQFIAAGFLLVSLIVLLEGYYGVLRPGGDWQTIVVGAIMTPLSAFTLIWVLVTYKPPPKTAEVAPAKAAQPRPPTMATEPKARPVEALRCPSCGNPDLEGGYPEYRCPYCGSRFVAGQAPPGVAAGASTGCVNVVLVQAGEKRIEVVKVVRQATQLDLHAAVDLVDTPLSVVVENVTLAEGERIKAALERAGATVTLQHGEAAG